MGVGEGQCRPACFLFPLLASLAGPVSVDETSAAQSEQIISRMDDFLVARICCTVLLCAHSLERAAVNGHSALCGGCSAICRRPRLRVCARERSHTAMQSSVTRATMGCQHTQH